MKIGTEIGSLVCVGTAERNRHRQQLYEWSCGCGGTRVTTWSGAHQSLEASCSRRCPYNQHVKHGAHDHDLYHTANGIIQRTTNPNASNWHQYGGRGITLHEPWKDIRALIDYLEILMRSQGETWESCKAQGLTVDRIENEGHYEPGNLQFADQPTQSGNKRSSVMIGDLCQSQAARKAGLDPSTVCYRRRAGWPESRWLEPVKKK